MSKVSDLEGANLALNQKIADMAQDMEDRNSAHRFVSCMKKHLLKVEKNNLLHTHETFNHNIF